MDTPPPDDVPPPEPPILLPAADLPPLDEAELESVTVLQPAARPIPKRALFQAAGTVLFVVSAVALGFFEREAWIFLLLGALVPPMATLPLLAYVGEREFVARVMAFLVWLGVIGAAAVNSFVTVANAIPSGDSARLVLTVVGITGGITFGILCFLSGVREFAARHLPIDPRSFVHAVALGGAVALAVIFFVPVLVLGGPPALDECTVQDSVEKLQQFPPGFILRLLCYAYFWIIVGELCIVGFPIVRSARDALRRLGLVRPTVGQVAFAVIAAIALLVLVAGVEWVIGHVWDLFHWPRTNEKSFNHLMGFAISPIGALVVGVTAGLSEELAIRGALQPRLGILLSNLLFTSAHAFQYNWDGLLSVFLIGLVLALIRRRFNTTTSAIVHGTYDSLAILVTYWTLQQG
jgi:hypothetical protein